MGRFSTTVHVKDNVGRIEFINSFCGIMKNHGFVPCSEDEAEQSYVFAFGDGWVTLVNKDYKDDRLKAGDDAMNMSAALKTSAFMMDVIDSDFAYIHLFAPNGGKDGVAVGDTSGYGVEKAEKRKAEILEAASGRRQNMGAVLRNSGKKCSICRGNFGGDGGGTQN